MFWKKDDSDYGQWIGKTWVPDPGMERYTPTHDSRGNKLHGSAREVLKKERQAQTPGVFSGLSEVGGLTGCLLVLALAGGILLMAFIEIMHSMGYY